MTEPWPPQWKPLSESPQVRYGMINPQIYEWDLDKFENMGDLKKFLQQLRDSRGYDIDCHPPKSVHLHSSFWADDPKYWKDESLTKRVEFAVNEINAQAQKHGERYELEDIVRVVECFPHRRVLLTLNVREVAPNTTHVVKTVQAMVHRERGHHDRFELCEWRFRPGPPEIAPKLSDTDL